RRLGPTPIFHHPYRRRHGHGAQRDWSDGNRLRRSQHAERLLRGGSPLILSPESPTHSPMKQAIHHSLSGSKPAALPGGILALLLSLHLASSAFAQGP